LRQGYLKKVGNSAKVVDVASALAQTKPGTVGISVSILRPGTKIHDHISLEKPEQPVEEENGKV